MSRSPAASRRRAPRPLLNPGGTGTRNPGPFLAWYEALFRAYGPQGWWPAHSQFEIVVGAILTQGVAWTNVEKAIVNLKAGGLLDPGKMRRAGVGRLARLIRPAGFFNLKARRLMAFLRRLETAHRGRLDHLFHRELSDLREELLALPGIGRETADAILLYAAHMPTFVIDAYTRRILRRHGEARGDEPYEELRALFERSLPPSAALFNEYHALLVQIGKRHCLKGQPSCRGCPLEPHLPPGGPPKEPRPSAKLTQAVASTRVAPR